VQSFCSRLIDLNYVVSLLPGDDEPLTDTHLKKAFNDGMAASWKDRFVSSGESFSKLTRNQVVQNFREQENLATRKERTNEEEQRRQKRTQEARSKTKGGASTQHSEKKPKVTPGKDSDPCPVNPNASYTLAECLGLKWNKNSKPNSTGRPNDKSKLKEANNYQVVVADPEPTDPEVRPPASLLKHLSILTIISPPTIHPRPYSMTYPLMSQCWIPFKWKWRAAWPLARVARR
jgi:hypothetical protein